MKKSIKILSVFLAVFLFGNILCLNVEADAGELPVYHIYPTPQNIEYGATQFKFPKSISLTLDDTIDSYTRDKAYDVFSSKDLIVDENKKDSTFYSVIIATKDNEEILTSLGNSSELTYLSQNYDAYYLSITESRLVLVGKDTDACFYGLETLQYVFDQSDSMIRELTIKDYSNSKYRGFIEGFYGIPWSSDDRKSLMEFGSLVKSNIYIYAPKDDSYHSTNWRSKYSDNDLAILKEQIEVGKKTKTEFAWAIHPFLSNKITEANYEESLTIIEAKFEQLYDAGIRQFVVSADDVEVPAGQLVTDGSLHQKLLNDLSIWQKDKEGCKDLIFVPSAYCYESNTRLKVDLEPYYQSLMNGLDDSVEIMWTGNDVCSSIETGKFTEFSSLTNGKKAFMWLNWPVNDYATSHLLMGKAEVLNKEYADASAVQFSGIVTNPMQQAEPSKISIFSVCSYAWNCCSFDMDDVYQASFQYIEGTCYEELKMICEQLCNATEYEGKYFEEATELSTLISSFETKNSLDKTEVSTEVESLMEYLTALIDACDTLQDNALNKDLVKSMLPWILAVKDTASATKNYLSIILMDGIEEKKQTLEIADAIYNHISSNKAIQLNKINYNQQYETVDVGICVLTPFLNRIKNSVTDTVKLEAGENTGTVYSGFNSIYSGSLDNITDGDEDTYCWFNGNPAEDAYIRIDLGEATNISNLKIVFKNANGYGDYFVSNVEYSMNGKDFIKVGETSSSINKIYLEEQVEARFIRLVNNGTETWVSLAEVSINSLPISGSKVTYDGLPLVPGQDVADMVDQNEATYTWFDWHAPKDSFIQIDLGSKVLIQNIYFVQGNGDHTSDVFESCSFYYSADGSIFYPVGDATYESVHNIFINLSEAVEARYIKVVSNSDSNPSGVEVEEFGVNKESVVAQKEVSVNYSIESGTHFIEGSVPAITVSVTEGVEYEVYYTTNDGETNLGENAPTTPGTYAINVVVTETEANKGYTGFRWYVIDARTELLTPEVTFSIENGTHFTEGSIQTITYTVPADASYTVYYTKDDGATNLGENAPTTAGLYAINIHVNEDSKYKETHFFRWYQIDAKASPEITFSIENGTHFTEGYVPTITVGAPEGVSYNIYYTKDEGETNLGAVAPTTAGTYAINVQTEETTDYLAAHFFRWYVIDAKNETVTLSLQNDFDAVTKVWGNDGNNGVDTQNVSYLEDGSAIVTIDGTTRTGGALESKTKYSSGSFVLKAKTTSKTGVATAFWTFYYADGGNVNNEIDIEAYGNNNVVFSSYTSEANCTSEAATLPFTLSDNEVHEYRFDWKSGEYVSYYIDGVLIKTITTNVPTEDMNLWIGAWCPSWAGSASTETSKMTIISCTYTSF